VGSVAPRQHAYEGVVAAYEMVKRAGGGMQADQSVASGAGPVVPLLDGSGGRRVRTGQVGQFQAEEEDGSGSTLTMQPQASLNPDASIWVALLDGFAAVEA
jgi:hypothetical protein